MGIDFKNFLIIGAAFTDVKSSVLYPMIGMRSLRECIVVNFGQKQFMFDIDQYAHVSIKDYLFLNIHITIIYI